jgi:hypothetical protein
MNMYEVRLVGDEARIGSVSASDVANLILGLQRTLARASGVVLGHELKPTGRWRTVIKSATDLRLVAIKSGSVVIELRPPPAPLVDDDSLDMDVESLSDNAWQLALASLHEERELEYDVAKALATWADDLAIGVRYEAIELRSSSASPPMARLDGNKRAWLRDFVARPVATKPNAGLRGVLIEADFEKRTAKVRTLAANLVEVLFEETQADDIQDALRQQSQFEGDVEVDPVTNSVRAVRLRRLVRSEQLILGDDAGAFWRHPNFDEERRVQATAAVRSFEGLYGEPLSDDDFDQFLDAIEN